MYKLHCTEPVRQVIDNAVVIGMGITIVFIVVLVSVRRIHSASVRMVATKVLNAVRRETKQTVKNIASRKNQTNACLSL